MKANHISPKLVLAALLLGGSLAWPSAALALDPTGGTETYASSKGLSLSQCRDLFFAWSRREGLPVDVAAERPQIDEACSKQVPKKQK